MINYEIKSQLAKLLATEDLVVENRNVDTAQFNVETRVLTLPMWKRASESVYDMLVGHEVGHALYTPNDWSFEDKIPKQFVNVVEDARIEKLMKRRYPGISKSFYRGYKELAEKDFFQLENQDLSKMNLADRVNLWFKIGNFVDVPFTDKEQDIVNMISVTETFADAIVAAEELYKYCKDEQKNNKQDQNTQQDIDVVSSNSSEQGDQKESFSSEEVIGDTNETTNDHSEHVESENSGDVEPEVQTDQTFEEGTQDLNNNSNTYEPKYCEIPKVDINQLIVSNQKVHDELDASWAKQSQVETYWDAYLKKYLQTKPCDFSYPDNEYKSFKQSTQKEVNYMVKEFECKKSADAYSRSMTSRTGVLDCTKLHTYKYNEDLFKKVSVIPDGKNHGLIFILDWSGSMANCILDTIKQLYNLVWFCNKVNIPFDVYAFTNNYIEDPNQYRNSNWEELEYQEVNNNNFLIHPDFRLIHFLTSDVKKSQLDKQMLSLWRIVFSMRKYCNYEVPGNFSLSGTPLNEAIVCLHEIIPFFQKKNRVQKVNVFILTDGEANSLPILQYGNWLGTGEKLGVVRASDGDYLRNRKTGYTYRIEYDYFKFTEILLKNLRQEFTNVNFIGIRLTTGSDFKSFITRYMPEITDNQYKTFRQNKFCVIKNSGYNSYFGMIDSALNSETEFCVDEGASKAKIKSAFVKNLRSKALNKKVLSQFMDLIS